MKVAVITGAGSGIGRATACALVAEGYSIVLAGRQPETLETTLRESGAPPARAMIVPTDVTQPDSVRILFQRTQENFGRVDLLFNNAGVSGPDVALEDLPFDRWKQILDTNLTGAFLCTQEAIRLMKQQQPSGGRIINNGSVSAHSPRPNSAPYTAAKHGITGLTKSTALDGRPFNIACGQIDIGNAETSMAAKMKQGVRQADGRIATEPTFAVAEVARAIVYMAGLPLNANVPSLTLMATGMPYIGRG